MAARKPTGGGAPKRRREPSFNGDDGWDDDERPVKPVRPAARQRAPKPKAKGAKKKAGGAGAGGGGATLGFLLRWGLTAAVWGVILVIGVLAYYAHDLPDIRALDAGTRRPMITLLDRTGQPFMTFGDNYGQVVSLKQVPAYLPEAIIATEDRRFYDHFGLDPIGVLRALVVNLAPRHGAPGRQHHHPAAGQEPVPDARAHHPAQGPGDVARALARASFQQGPDPHALSQPGLSRRRHLWRRGRGAPLFRQAGAGADALRGGDASPGLLQRAVALQPGEPSRRRRRPRARRCSPTWWMPAIIDAAEAKRAAAQRHPRRARARGYGLSLLRRLGAAPGRRLCRPCRRPT